MGTVTHLYDPNQDVYVINGCGDRYNNEFVRAGTVIRVRIEVLATETTIKYDVRLTGQSGTQEFMEADVFPDKSTAIAEYETRVA